MERLLRAFDAPGSVTSPPTAGSVCVLFSSLRMHDGELTGYDLESLERPPALLVLAACDVGMSQIQAGDELMGVAAEVLSMGTRTVVATFLPVPDDRVRHLMGALHQRLRDGEAPADALVRPGPTCRTTRRIRCRASSASARAGRRPAARCPPAGTALIG